VGIGVVAALGGEQFPQNLVSVHAMTPQVA
jgi:hypothetical protein